ncbi:hypothetical protein RclHR1_04400007 [Rhizophagus clarus]|uniref:Thioredoxin-like protein n=1 Tax=Rhizophagus clarus TaxID=94130 RepID=A0A2Z6RII1_9GLOM|nr:hypothetical protein RclHR1_04400007 [Rhizophagus clarus]GES99248.1 thioredoxin-like protein [Rhizophagus clarus]
MILNHKPKVELEIDDLSPVVIFSKSYYCHTVFTTGKIYTFNVSCFTKYFDNRVDKRDDADEFKQALIKTTYRSTFPNVFIDVSSIGV